jgi:hypothetical protein
MIMSAACCTAYKDWEPPCRAKLQQMLALGNIVGCCWNRAEGAGEVESRTNSVLAGSGLHGHWVSL